jgi:hypothetical protein
LFDSFFVDIEKKIFRHRTRCCVITVRPTHTHNWMPPPFFSIDHPRNILMISNSTLQRRPIFVHTAESDPFSILIKIKTAKG